MKTDFEREHHVMMMGIRHGRVRCTSCDHLQRLHDSAGCHTHLGHRRCECLRFVRPAPEVK